MIFNFHHHNKSVGRQGIYNLALHEKPMSFYFSAGLHPMDIDENADSNFLNIVELCKDKNCLVIGECGLDRLADAEMKRQEEVFRWHIKLAEEIDKPLVIHSVKTHYEVAKLCRETNIPVVFHGFNKKKDIAEMLIGKGFYLSFGAALLNQLSLQKTFREMPLSHCFLETDVADEAIDKIYAKASEIKGKPLSEIEKEINHNLNTIFNK